ncbi:MAG TPA: hypothetical protein VFN28_16180 [Amaricoccus sp.]|nr:hypothetical protein [Amaricoccus sp.]
MIFFVHIGKTAGSTMNRYLAEAYRLGYGHCEAFIHQDGPLAERLAVADWMSGHVALPVARARLEPRRAGVRYFTCVRRPAAQVRSHYNWLVEIFHKGPEFYGNHPAPVRAISERVRATVANPTPAAIARDLRQFAGLFLDNQSRYLFGRDLAPVEAALAGGARFGAIPAVAEALGRFEAIGESGAIEALARHVIGPAAFAPEAGGKRENASRYHFDPALFEAEEVTETLRLHNRIDALLHAHLVARMTDGLLVAPGRAASAPAAAEAAGDVLGGAGRG